MTYDITVTPNLDLHTYDYRVIRSDGAIAYATVPEYKMITDASWWEHAMMDVESQFHQIDNYQLELPCC